MPVGGGYRPLAFETKEGCIVFMYEWWPAPEPQPLRLDARLVYPYG